MKDETPQQEAERLYRYFYLETDGDVKKYKMLAKFTAQQIADNTTGATKIYYLQVIKEIEKL
jgi:hypothetical protein